jgi:OmcA/MtrC family decaheme c-type cytochrome
MNGKLWFRFFLMGLMLTALVLSGCEGDDGDDGSAGATGAAGTDGASAYEIAVEAGYEGTEEDWLLSQAGVVPESCSICHGEDGDEHQAAYDENFQAGVIVATNLAYSNDGTNDTITFDMTMNDAPLDCTTIESLSIYFATYDAATNQFITAFRGIKGTLTADVAGQCTSTLASTTDLSSVDGAIVLYGVDGITYSNPAAHITIGKYPFADVLKTGTVPYVSAANVTGCEKCHTTPYLKHGYISGDVAAVDMDFYTCKACHSDIRDGGHEDWQYMVDNPLDWANGVAAPEGKYAYKTKLMNDVHMSHAMEFPYPQSIANCATCHEGKLTETLSDANFVLETCKSCHPVDGGTDLPDADGDFTVDTTVYALNTIIPHNWSDASDCTLCHNAGPSGIAPVFSDIHTGYDDVIYADTAGTKYSTEIVTTINAATLAGNVLTIEFSATGTANGLVAADILPTLLVSLYGYDAKDFIVSAHSRDENRDRFLEAEIALPDAGHPRITTLEAAAGSWVATADLSMWADMIADGTVRRVEIGVTSELEDATAEIVAINATSKTFDLAGNAFVDYYSDIVDVETGCNNCHDALATTFHDPDRGGSVTVCRMCHVTLSGGSHLEMQSRSIDSYTHAIHSFQPFDIGNIDFTDPVEAAHYEEHIGFIFPDFAIVNCEACHNPGTYNVPDQSKSMPGKFSAADEVAWRTIGAVPSYDAGPASRACGACHRAALINEDAAGELASFNSHTKLNGYLVVDEEGTLDAIIDFIMGMFN